jgi:hypothetical protein
LTEGVAAALPVDAFYKKNMAAAVKFSPQGLICALFLGVLQQKELLQLSEQLNNTFAALWVHLDVEENVRHLSYNDTTVWKHFEITGPPPPPTTAQAVILGQKHDTCWTIFFDFLWERHVILCKLKKGILQNLLSILQTNYNSNKNLRTKFVQCQQQLEKFTEKTKIIIFAPNDKIMHALKMPFASFAKSRKKSRFRGIALKTDGKNTILSMGTSFMQIDNVVQFFGVNFNPTDLTTSFYDDFDFKNVAKDWLDTPPNVQNLLPMPVIDPHLTYLAKQVIYSPGKIIDKHKSLKGYLNDRGRLLAHLLHQLHSTFCTVFVQKYCIELHTWPINSFPSLAFNVVWLQYCEMGGPFLHGPERMKPAYNDLLRKFSRGGFSWSFGSQLSSGDHFSSDFKAKAVVEFDICSSYGFAGANMTCPSGFCVGYIKNTDHHVNDKSTQPIIKCDRFRHQSYEFRATYFYLFCLVQEQAEITAVYSNYHVLGVFNIGNYPIDLVVITKNLGMFVVQFDHLYTHGCRQGCPGLPRYASNKTREQLEKKSQERDDVTEQWIASLSKEQNCTEVVYHVMSECHSPGFDKKNLNSAFLHVPLLNQLIKPYLSLPAHAFTPTDLLHLDPDVTFIMICQGHTPPKNYQSVFPPLFVWKQEQGADRYQDFSHQTISDMLVSQDHFNYLVLEHNFQLDSIAAILFFKKDKILPLVFEQLIQEKYRENLSSSKIGVTKSLINFACGYFGLNNSKQKNGTKKKWLVTGFKFGDNLNNYDIEPVGEFQNNIYFTRKQLTRSNYNGGQIINAPLAIFCCIIDFGKKRLGECFTFIEKIATPGSFRLLYSHIDNMLLALGATELENIVSPKMRQFFEQHKMQFIHQTCIQSNPLPGQLKQEFCVNSSTWKFSSPFPCCYVLVDDDNPTDNVCKMSSISNITPTQSYQNALKYLNKETVFVSQTRRLNKLSNTKKHTVEIQLKKNKK